MCLFCLKELKEIPFLFFFSFSVISFSNIYTVQSVGNLTDNLHFPPLSQLLLQPLLHPHF